MQNYVIPTTMEQVLEYLAFGDWVIVAGGTDVYPAFAGKPINLNCLDVSRVESLRNIEKTDKYWRIGGSATWTDIIRANLPSAFDGLKLAAREVGSVQIQNAGTIAGNLCNASPAADGVPPLLTLNAQVELSSSRGVRVMPVSEFIQGNRRTQKNADEIISAVLVPHTATGGSAHFLKLGSRSHLVISIVSVSVRLEAGNDGIVSCAAVAVGSCSEVACRLPALEVILIGKPLNTELANSVHAEHLSTLSPIDDIRGTADYRMQAAQEMVRRAILGCLPGCLPGCEGTSI